MPRDEMQVIPFEVATAISPEVPSPAEKSGGLQPRATVPSGGGAPSAARIDSSRETETLSENGVSSSHRRLADLIASMVAENLGLVIGRSGGGSDAPAPPYER